MKILHTTFGSVHFFLYLCTFFDEKVFRMKKILVFLLLLPAILLVSCRKQSKYESLRDRAFPVEIEVVSESRHTAVGSYVGEIKAETSIPLVFPMGGQLTGIMVQNGQHVRKGDVIATIDPTQAQALYESSQAILHQAEDAYERLKPVYEGGGISEVKWVEMQTNLQKARSMAISAEKRLLDCTLRAPEDGAVELNNVEVGQQLAIAQPIGQLVDMSAMRAEFTVPESEVALVTHGSDVQIYVPALDRTYDAKVDSKSIIAGKLAHTFSVSVVLVDKKASDHLLQGMVCRARISKNHVNGYVISSGCVQTQRNGHSVWVLRNGRTERVMIQIGDFVENGVLVTDGLHAGDTVIAKGYQKMFQGARVSF